MKKLRECMPASFNTGVSKCPIDFGKMLGAILVLPGTKLFSDRTAEGFTEADDLEMCAHMDANERIYGIVRFTEYAKNGGEVQTATNGYGPEEATGVSARRDTYTLDRFYPELHAALTRNANRPWDVYFFDENNVLYGINDGTDVLAGFPMSTVYSDATPHPTSSAKATMSVSFCHRDAKKAIVDFDYMQLDCDPTRLTLALTPVKLVKADGVENGYKLVEAMGDSDLTPIYGPLLVAAKNDAVENATAVTFDKANKVLVITVTAVGKEVRLASPFELYKSDIKGIEQI